MVKHAWVPVVVALVCAWGALTLLHTPAPARDIASAAEDYPYPTSTSEAVIDDTATPSETSEATPSETPVDVEATAEILDTETPIPELPPEEQPQAAMEPSDLAVAPTETPYVEILQCKPDQTYLIRGVTTPYTQLLLKFADRIVGGSMSDATGEFAVPLTMGHEVAGTHTIAILVRDTGAVVATMPCIVP